MATLKNKAVLPPERDFGLLVATLLVGLAVYGFWQDWGMRRYGALAVTGLFFAMLAFAAPGVLAPLNTAWFQLGRLMGKVVNPFVLGIFFFGLLTPVGLICRLFGRDELSLKRRQQDSYWISREQLRPDADSFKRQF